MSEKDRQDTTEEDIFSSFDEEVSKEEVEAGKLPEEDKGLYESLDPYWDIPPPEIKKKGVSEQQKRRIEMNRLLLRVDQLLASDPYFDIKSPVDEKEPVNLEKGEDEEEEIEIEQGASPKASPFKFAVIPLSGRLRTAIDGTQLGEGDMQVMSNLRYGRKSPKSVAGMTKINSNIFYSG